MDALKVHRERLTKEFGPNGNGRKRDFILVGKADAPPEPKVRPPIIYDKLNPNPAIRLAMRQLEESGAPFYRRGGQLVYLTVDEEEDEEGNEISLPSLVFDDVAGHLKYELNECASWKNAQGGSIELPRTIPNDIPGLKGPFKRVSAISTTPTLRWNGKGEIAELLAREGYDEKTGLLLVGLPQMPLINPRPTRSEAEAALRLLKDLHAGVAFLSDADRAVQLSAVVSGVGLGALDFTPLHYIRASEAGSGKSYLAHIVHTILSGERCPVVASVDDEGEQRKRIEAAIMKGRQVINLDNLDHNLNSPFLCQALTERDVELRMLGFSRAVTLRNKSLVMANGNSVTPVGDLVRRTIMCLVRKDTSLRTFDPLRRVRADRGRYVAAALTIVLAYQAAGTPDVGLRSLASFDRWSRLVRDALVWLGEADPVMTQDELYSEDPQRRLKVRVLAGMASVFGLGRGNRKFAGQMLKETRLTLEDERPERSALRGALEEACGGESRVLGHWLGRFEGAILDELVLRKEVDSHTKQLAWWVERST